MASMGSLGLLGPDEGVELGEVTAGAVDDSGRAAIVDALASQVVLFSPQGRNYSRLSGPGDGPGELRDPIAVSFLPDARLAVVDRTHRKIAIFQLQQGGAKVLTEIRLDFAPSALCAIRDELVVLGRRGGETIHIVTQNGARRQSFATGDSLPTGASDALGQMAMQEAAEGFLACMNDTTVVHSLARRGIVKVVNLRSGEVKRINIVGFVEPLRIVRGSGIRFDLDPRVGFAHTVVAVLPMCPALATVIIRESRARGDTAAAKVFGIDIWLERESPLRWTAGVPEVFAVGGQIVLGRSTEPVPAVTLWRRPPAQCSSGKQ